MNDYQRQNIQLTKHAQERFRERGNKKELLKLLRSSEKAYEVGEKAYFKNQEYVFVCKQFPRHTLVITCFKEGHDQN